MSEAVASPPIDTWMAMIDRLQAELKGPLQEIPDLAGDGDGGDLANGALSALQRIDERLKLLQECLERADGTVQEVERDLTADADATWTWIQASAEARRKLAAAAARAV